MGGIKVKTIAGIQVITPDSPMAEKGEGSVDPLTTSALMVKRRQKLPVSDVRASLGIGKLDISDYTDSDLGRKLEEDLKLNASKNFTVQQVMRSLQTSVGTIDKLVQMGELDLVSGSKKRIGSADLITRESYVRLLNPRSIAGDNIIQDVYNSTEYFVPRFTSGNKGSFIDVFGVGGIIQEICRFNDLNVKDLDLVEYTALLHRKDNPDESYRGKVFLRKQIEPLLKEGGRRIATRVGWVTALWHYLDKRDEKIHKLDTKADAKDNVQYSAEPAESDTFGKDALGWTLDEMGLQHTAENRRRLLMYCSNGYLPFQDLGFLVEAVKSFSYKDDQRERRVLRYFQGLYMKYLSDEIEFAHISKIGHRTGDMLFQYGIQPYTNKAEVETFLRKTVDEKTFSGMIFPGCEEFFEDALNEELSFADLLSHGAKSYSRKEVTFFEPYVIDGKRKYHPADKGLFIKRLFDSGLYGALHTAIRFRIEGKHYDPAKITEGFSISETADKLHTTVEKASILGVEKADVGLIAIVSEKVGYGADLMADFYRQFLKGKVPEFTDVDIHLYRVTEAILEDFKNQRFPKTVRDTGADNRRLQRQYKIDKQHDGNAKPGLLFSKELAPFKTNGVWVNTKACNARINELLKSSYELRQRIRWDEKLEAFYEDPSSIVGYGRVDALQDRLGLSKAEWDGLNPKVHTVNPAVVAIQAEKKNGKSGRVFMSPRAFDEKYYPDGIRDYISIKTAKAYAIEKFCEPGSVSKELTKVDCSIDILLEESNQLGIDVKGLSPYTLKAEDRKGKFYFLGDVSAVRNGMGNVNLKKLQIALALSELDVANMSNGGGSNYQSPEKAAKSYKVTVEQLGKFSPQYLQIEDVGVVPEVVSLLRRSNIADVNEADVIGFCKSDERYTSVQISKVVTNLDEFQSQLKTTAQSKKEILGSEVIERIESEGEPGSLSSLANAVYDYCVAQVKPTYFDDGERKIHDSDVKAMKAVASGDISNCIKGAVAERLGKDNLSDKCITGIGIGSSPNLLAIIGVASHIDSFATHLYNRSRTEKELGVTFRDDTSWNDLMGRAAPGCTTFDGMYLNSDFEELWLVLEDAAEKLRTGLQTTLHFAEKGYIRLSENGVDEKGVKSLIQNSYSERDVARISGRLHKELANALGFSNGEGRLYPLEELRQLVHDLEPEDITRDGMTMLLRDGGWRRYVAIEEGLRPQNSNGNNVELLLTEHLLGNLQVGRSSEGYSTRNFLRLLEYAQFLQREEVHGIPRFITSSGNGGLYIDPHTNYYFISGAWSILGIDRVAEFDGLVDELQLKPLTHDKLKLFSMHDVAQMVRHKKGHILTKYIEDDLEAVMISAIHYKKRLRLPSLQLKFSSSTGYLRDFNDITMKNLAHEVKIGYDYCERVMKRLFETVTIMIAGQLPNVYGAERDAARMRGARLYSNRSSMKM